MKCFLACFSASKHQIHQESIHKSTSDVQKHETDAILQSTNTLMLEVEKHESDSVKLEETINPISESKETQKKVTFDLDVKSHEEISTEIANSDNGYEGNVKNHANGGGGGGAGCGQPLLIEQESSDSLFSIAIGSRKQVNGLEMDQESLDSLFSVSIDSRKHQLNGIEKGEKEVNSPMPKPILSVLKPLENLTDLKSVKGNKIPLPQHHQEKENIPIKS